MENGKGPEKSYGKGTRVSVWRNTGTNGSYPSFRIERRYKDTDGSWKSSASFTLSQMLRLHALLSRAIHDYIDEEDSSSETD